MNRGEDPQQATDVLASVLKNIHSARERVKEVRPDSEKQSAQAKEASRGSGKPAFKPGRYDFDLAEFPLFRFEKPKLSKHSRDPLRYSDTIKGKDGKAIVREWEVYPGPDGFGGASAHSLLYDLLQMYVEQGCQGTQLQFGSLRTLLQRRGSRNPSSRDYARIKRDINVLRGYDFRCKNAFWDGKLGAYVDMNWRLFGSVFYFKERPTSQVMLPFGFIEVSPVLQEIARTRGFFAVGFGTEFFHSLRPLEQRLAIYLAKKFVSQKKHQRFVDDLAQALPIEASRPRDLRRILKRAAEGLLEKGIPILASFDLEQGADKRWKAIFRRRSRPEQHLRVYKRAAEALSPELEELVDRMVQATGNAQDRAWWIQCAKRLGYDGVGRALGQLKEKQQMTGVSNPGGLLTKILKDIAREWDVSLTDKPGKADRN